MNTASPLRSKTHNLARSISWIRHPNIAVQITNHQINFKYASIYIIICSDLSESTFFYLLLLNRLYIYFQGKVAVVTGGDSGIGRAVCNLFSLEGATVIFTYVKEHEDIDAKDTLEIIRKAKTADAKDPMAIAVDVGYEVNCKRVVDEVVDAYGRIDILVNNAAEQYETESLEEIDETRLERVFRTNIFSHFFMTK